METIGFVVIGFLTQPEFAQEKNVARLLILAGAAYPTGGRPSEPRKTKATKQRFCFLKTYFDSSILDPLQLGPVWKNFHFIQPGVLYPQYIGKGFSIVRLLVDRLLEPHGVLATVHIDEWCPWRFPYTLLHSDLSPYRQYFHRLEVFLK